MLDRSVGEECCREVMEKSDVETRCRELSEKSVGDKCCRDVLLRSDEFWRDALEKGVVEKCWRRVFWRLVVEK